MTPKHHTKEPSAAEDLRAGWIGKTVLIGYGDGVLYRCEVIDAKQTFGHRRLKIKPAAGTGEGWIDAKRAQADVCRPAQEKSTDVWPALARTQSAIGVHLRHCCTTHGCKYADEDCPVANGTVKPDPGQRLCCAEADRAQGGPNGTRN